MSYFASFEIGRQALRAQFKGLEVSGQNVANANTEGYSRQRVIMEAVVPPPVPGTQMSPGRGVVVSDIQRVTSEFYFTQMINTGSQKQYWTVCSETCRGIEVIFMEPEESALGQYITDFFDLWQELSSAPESAAVRMGLLEQAQTLTRAVEDIYLRLQDLQANMRNELEMRIGEVNRLAAELAEINEKIAFVHALGQTSNELLDQRDLVIQELSGLIDVRVHEKENRTVDVQAAGRPLVHGETFFPLQLGVHQGELQVLSHRSLPLAPQSGRIPGLLKGINHDIPRRQDELNLLVSTLVAEVNRIHSAGYGKNGDTGLNFFLEIADNGIPPAMQFRVNRHLLDHPDSIAASTGDGETGNGENALALARLRLTPQDSLFGSSLSEYYRAMITALGVDGQESERMVEAFEKVEMQVREQHRAVSGVNLDEEVLNMVQYQHAWQAAARFLSYVDQMLGTLFHELGR